MEKILDRRHIVTDIFYSQLKHNEIETFLDELLWTKEGEAAERVVKSSEKHQRQTIVFDALGPSNGFDFSY